MLRITGLKELNEIKPHEFGHKRKTILSAIFFRYTTLYRDEFNLPKIKQAKDGRYYFNDKQLSQIKEFLDKYLRADFFQFYLSIERDTKKEKGIAKVWEKKLWN